MEVMVVGVRRYNFRSESDGRFISGAKVAYLDRSDPVLEPDARGWNVVTLTGPVELFEEMDDFPAICDLDLMLTPASGGKTKVGLRGLRFIRLVAFDNGAVVEDQAVPGTGATAVNAGYAAGGAGE